MAKQAPQDTLYAIVHPAASPRPRTISCPRVRHDQSLQRLGDRTEGARQHDGDVREDVIPRGTRQMLAPSHLHLCRPIPAIKEKHRSDQLAAHGTLDLLLQTRMNGDEVLHLPRFPLHPVLLSTTSSARNTSMTPDTPVRPACADKPLPPDRVWLTTTAA